MTVTDKDGTVHEDVGVWDYTLVVTETFEVWQFQLRGPEKEAKVYSGQIELVEVCE